MCHRAGLHRDDAPDIGSVDQAPTQQDGITDNGRDMTHPKRTRSFIDGLRSKCGQRLRISDTAEPQFTTDQCISGYIPRCHAQTSTMLALFQLPCTEVMAPAIRFNFTVILNDTTNSLN